MLRGARSAGCGGGAPERLDAAEEADDAEGADGAGDARGLLRVEDAHDGEDDDGGVEHAPRVGDEGGEPGAEGVDGELDAEDGGEEEVPAVELDREVGLEAVVVDQARGELRLDDGAHEVLLARGGAASGRGGRYSVGRWGRLPTPAMRRAMRDWMMGEL